MVIKKETIWFVMRAICWIKHVHEIQGLFIPNRKVRVYIFSYVFSYVTMNNVWNMIYQTKILTE